MQSLLGESRNMYDRLVHVSFGFLLAYPIREVFLRVTRVKASGATNFIRCDAGVLGGLRIIEWLAAANVGPAAGLAFLGSQGNIWDAQKDMTMAGIGALLAMIVIALINMKYQPGFWQEMKASFKIEAGDAPLGERRLAAMRGTEK
jgi:putative membrane protein